MSRYAEAHCVDLTILPKQYVLTCRCGWHLTRRITRAKWRNSDWLVDEPLKHVRSPVSDREIKG